FGVAADGVVPDADHGVAQLAGAAGADRLTVPVGALTGGGGVAGIEEWQVDHAHHRPAVGDQGQRDATQRYALGEVDGAVHRVQGPLHLRAVAGAALLLSEYADRGRGLGEKRADLALDGVVDLGGVVPVALRGPRARRLGQEDFSADRGGFNRHLQQGLDVDHASLGTVNTPPPGAATDAGPGTPRLLPAETRRHGRLGA